MAAPSSVITQVQQGTTGVSVGSAQLAEIVTLNVRGQRFELTREELLTLPEFVLLTLFPNGLFPDPSGPNHEVNVDSDPQALEQMLTFFRDVCASGEEEESAVQDRRAGIIVLREDLDFYVIPPRADLAKDEMPAIKRAAGQRLQQQDGIFAGLRRCDEPNSTEVHLVEMLTAGGFDIDAAWGYRESEPGKAVISSLALTRLRTGADNNELSSEVAGMAQKLLLFWRKPARRCWWEGVELEGVDGVEGKLKVWIRRVWTLEMSVVSLR